ncbi:hypothetical protein [Microvirga pakistanensis]|uniref:hypothetical protein n=1 Tax=Microvirga pakistanensis TaxID=1682650 RepID=UPI00106D2CD9|nr:hypothetical protein [Microvirga pakistanensis]
MRAVLSKVVSKAAEIGGRFVLQVTVSVAATVCVASITGSFLKTGAPTESPVHQQVSSLEPGAAVSLLNANFTEDGFRTRVASVEEFSMVFGPNEHDAFAPPVARDWSPDLRVADLEADVAPSAKVRQAGASTCSEACSRLPSSGILPPARPAAAGSMEVAQAAAASEGAIGGSRLQLLGMSLPDVIPSPERLLTRVTSWGGAVADLVLK